MQSKPFSELKYGDIVMLADKPGCTFAYVGYDSSTDEAIIRSGTDEITRVGRNMMLRPSEKDLEELLNLLLKSAKEEEKKLTFESYVSAETFTEEQKGVGSFRTGLIQKYEKGEIDSLRKLQEAMGLKDTAFEEVMRRWRADPRWQSVTPKRPGRTTGQSDQDPELIQLYMRTFDEFYGEGVTQKALYMEFCNRCSEGVVPFAKSTAGRIFRAIDPRIRDKKSQGPDHANKIYNAYPSSFELDRPLRRIQIDSSPADIEVTDSLTDKPLGRPYLTVVTDEYSGGILAATISFLPPCRATIAAALYEAFMPKTKLLADLGLAGQRWTLYGAPAGILVDKGSEHDNKHFRMTCELFGVEYEYRRRPQHGGSVENGVKLVNVFFIHRLAGSTGSSPKKSKDFNPRKKASYDIKTLQRLVILEAIRLNDEIRDKDRQSPNGRWDSYFSDPNTPLNMPPIMRDAFAFMVNMLPGGRVFVHREGIKYGGYVYDHGDLFHLVERKIKVSVRRSPLDLRTLYVLHDGVWRTHTVLKPSGVPATLIEEQVLKRFRPKAGEMTTIGHAAYTEIQDIIASTMAGAKKQARARESVALAEERGILPRPEAAPAADPPKTESNRFAHIKPYKGEDDR